MSDTGICMVKNDCFHQQLEEDAGWTSGHHFKLETEAELEQSNSMGVGFKGRPRK